MVFLLWVFFATPALARTFYVHKVFTPPAETVTRTYEPKVLTLAALAVESTTLFVATTAPPTLATGIVETTSLITKEQPVSNTNTYPQTSLSETLNPDSYSNGITILKPSIGATATFRDESSQARVSGSDKQSIEQSVETSVSTYVSSVAAVISDWTNGRLVVTTKLLSASGKATVTVTHPSSAQIPPAASKTAAVVEPGSDYTSVDMFSPVDTAPPPAMFQRAQIPFNLPAGVDRSRPIHTNKFYNNLVIDGQNLTVFAQPYNVFWSKDENYYGFGIQYTNATERLFGSVNSLGAASFYTNPLMLKAFVLSASEFSPSSMELGVSDSGPLSVSAQIKSSSGGFIDIPIAIGMGMVTGVYHNLTPKLFSQLGVQKVVNSTLLNGVQKYQATLFNGLNWNIYVTAPAGEEVTFLVNSNFEMEALRPVSHAVIQIAYAPTNSDQVLDNAAGIYPTSATISGSAYGKSATYQLKYNCEGSSMAGAPLIYALGHHVQSFSLKTLVSKTSLRMDSGTKGELTGVLSDTLEMNEQLTTDLQWLPYQDGMPDSVELSPDALMLLAKVVNEELSEDMIGQTNTASTYTAGKGLDKFAYILLVASEILGSKSLSKEGLESLKKAISPWLRNQQLTPFIYDTLMKGITSSAANNGGSPNDDFGAPFYNDHHFHYGYYVHAAAVIGMIDEKLGGTWAQDNKAWVNSLIRDVANPSEQDAYFPVFRMFDFYHGHSWAHGLFASGDGKDEESTSEDYNFAYAMKLWGKVTKDTSMEARGDLMLAIMKRTMPLYFYYDSSNTVQPPNYIRNRVAGITFENKLHHTTYFGTNLEYVQGIHMIPITGASGLIRGKSFVQQEWDDLLAPIVDGLDSGWAGILRSNQALIDPKAAYRWFARDDFDTRWLDGGASRTWYLTLAAALGGSI